jgi:hypothetical protein
MHNGVSKNIPDLCIITFSPRMKGFRVISNEQSPPPPDELAPLLAELRALFGRHGYTLQ